MSARLQRLHWMSPENLFVVKCSFERGRSLSYLHKMSESVVAFRCENSLRVVRTAIHVLRRRTWHKPFFLLFPTNCRYWTRNVRPFGVYFLGELSKLHPTWTEEHWTRKTVFLPFFVPFGHWATILPPFGGNVSAGLAKMLSTCREDEIDVNQFLLLSSDELSILSRKFPALCCNCFGRVRKSATCVSRGTKNWGKHFVFEFYFVIFGHWADTFWLLVQDSWMRSPNCNLRVQRYIAWKELFLLFPLFLFIFWHWAKSFGLFAWEFLLGFSKLQSKRSEEPFVKKQVQWKCVLSKCWY